MITERWGYRLLNHGTVRACWQVFERGTLAHVVTVGIHMEGLAKEITARLNAAEKEKDARER